MDIVTAPGAPAAVGPYSHALDLGPLVFCSGQVALDAESGQLVGEDVAAQTRKVFRNIEAVLAAAGLKLGHVAKATVFLTTMDDFTAMNAVYQAAFGGHKPARSTIAVAGLPVGALVEIEVIAARPS